METNKVMSKHNAEHYVWGQNCDGWRLVDREERSIIHERMHPGTYEERHYHEKSSQFFFVLSGQMTIEIEGTEYTVNPHEGIEVLPKKPHQVFNKSAGDLEFIVTSTPNTRNDRVHV